MDFSERKIALTLWTVFLLSANWFACTSKETSLPYYNEPEFNPIFISSKAEVARNIDHQISDFAFTDQNNTTITHSTIEGKVHVANFIFTSCGSICPKMTNNMKKVSDAFVNNSDVILLSYSVTPWIDDVETLNKYAKENEITASNWHLLTGNRSKIYELARKSYFAEEDLGFTKDSTEFLHTEHFILVDKTKRIRGIYNGTLQLEIEQLIKDIELLNAE